MKTDPLGVGPTCPDPQSHQQAKVRAALCLACPPAILSLLTGIAGTMWLTDELAGAGADQRVLMFLMLAIVAWPSYAIWLLAGTVRRRLTDVSKVRHDAYMEGYLDCTTAREEPPARTLSAVRD